MKPANSTTYGKPTLLGLSTLAAAFAALALTLLLPAGAAHAAVIFTADFGLVDGVSTPTGTTLTYQVTKEAASGNPGEVQVGNGQSTACADDYAGALVIPSSVSSGGQTYAVTSLAAGAFRASGVTSVELPSTLRILGKNCFCDANDLVDLAIPKDAQLTYIRDGAFRSNSEVGALRTLHLPASLKWIGANAFQGQAALTALTCDATAVDYLGEYAFANCANLVSAQIPGTTASGYGIDYHVFCSCPALEQVEFMGSVEKESDAVVGTITRGSRTFEGCYKLKTVLYRGKVYLPSWAYAYSRPPEGASTSSGMGRSFMDSDPTLYVSLTYYGSQKDALAKTSPLGSVLVRSGTILKDVSPSMEAADEAGAILWEGTPLAVPAGFTGWSYEGRPTLGSALEESLYVYPVGSVDFAYASIDLEDASLIYTGHALRPALTVTDASGKVLEEGVDYGLSFQRQGTDGTWQSTDDLTSLGTLRVVASPLSGAYTGQQSAEFQIVNASVGSTFRVGGITYCIRAVADGGAASEVSVGDGTGHAVDQAAGEVSVGDGTGHAVDQSAAGELTIPAVVAPEGSAVSYAVTSVAENAFGSSSADPVKGITKVNLPESITSIGTSAFAQCIDLESLVIPASVTKIGAYAFYKCTGLEDLAFEGDSISSLGAYAFAYCSGLSKLVLPTIGATNSHAFAYCSSLRRVDLRGTLPHEDLPTCFASCTRLSKLVMWGPAFTDPIPSEPLRYANVTFKSAAGAAMGSAVLAVGTKGSQMTPALASPALLEGAVPALPTGYAQWAVDGSETAAVSGACTATPVKADAGTATPAKVDPPKKTVSTTYTYTINTKTVTASKLSSSKARKATTIVLGSKVRKISAKAFAKCKATTLILKTGGLTKSRTKNCLKGSKIKKVRLQGTAAKKKRSAYRKIFGKKLA